MGGRGDVSQSPPPPLEERGFQEEVRQKTFCLRRVRLWRSKVMEGEQRSAPMKRGLRPGLQADLEKPDV